jgi:mannonate dehydratase
VFAVQQLANDQRKKRVVDSLAAIKHKMDRWSDAQSMTFIDVMEGTKPLDTLDKEWRPVAQAFRKSLDGWRATLLKYDLLGNYLDNYWPHEWKQESVEGRTLRRLFARRPVQGTEAYRKHRTIPTFREGVDFGLQPVTWNPTEMLQRKVFEMSQSLKGREMHADHVRSGIFAYVPSTKPRPEAIRHWQRVPEYALGTKYGPPTMAPTGRVVLGHYYAPPEVVRLIENHLSPGLWGKSVLYDAYKRAGNVTTQMLLGWSTFHLWLTGLESVISKASVASELLSRGEFSAAAKVGLQVGPQGVVRDLLRGYKAVQQFYSRDADANEDTGLIGTIVQAGGGFGWSDLEHEDMPAKFMTDLRGLMGAVSRGEPLTATKKLTKAAVHGAMAAYELPTSLIMNHWVPYLKVSAFLDMADMDYPDEGEMDFSKVMRILRDTQFAYSICADHMPSHPDDPGKLQAYAFGNGYIKALIQAVNSEVRS